MNNPAKQTLDRKKHEEKMAKLAAKGEPTYPFPGDRYSIDGVITTPKGERKVLRTGWKVPESSDSGSSDPVLLSAYIK